MQELTKTFSNDLSDLDFSLSVIKLCTRKPLTQPSVALAVGVGQLDLPAPDMYIKICINVTLHDKISKILTGNIYRCLTFLLVIRVAENLKTIAFNIT